MKPCPIEPDQLLLAAHLAVVAREAAGALRRCESVLDDPAERAGLETLRPPAFHSTRPFIRLLMLPAHGGFADCSTSGEQGPARCSPGYPAPNACSCCVRVDGAHLGQESNRVDRGANRVHAHQSGTLVDRPHDGGEGAVVTRCGDAPPSTDPMNALRDVPTSTGTSTRSTSSERRARSARLCSAVLPNPMPGSAQSASGAMPAARAASRRSTRKSPTSVTTSS